MVYFSVKWKEFQNALIKNPLAKYEEKKRRKLYVINVSGKNSRIFLMLYFCKLSILNGLILHPLAK